MFCSDDCCINYLNRPDNAALNSHHDHHHHLLNIEETPGAYKDVDTATDISHNLAIAEE
jgi:hypothetical protein